MGFPTTKPPFLYKYCSAERATQIVRDLTFYFAPAAQLNDLYEFRAGSLYTETPDSKFRVFAKRLVAERWFSDFSEALEFAKSADAPDVDSTYSAFIAQTQAFLKRIMEHSGVFCFSAEGNNQRMWGTYGNNHTGAVLEFSTSEQTSKFASHLMPVWYTDRKVPICPSELIKQDQKLDQWMVGVFFCIKHMHWRDEQEWRLLLLADSKQSTHDRIVPFEREALTRIFVGPRISSGDERSLRDAAAKKTPPVPVFKRQVDDLLAKEEYVGVEQISSFDQLMYWAKKANG